ncbi:MAG TPA: fumarylacetoacetate hydrolase family protein [Candidatus Methylomirabilis sp.]|nr:fumarylacetoacetate hydrolase family protein [Candidatus Methylomirabilis sp.]
MMDEAALKRAIDDFWTERERGVYFPAAWRDRLSLDDAYRIQLALVERRCTGGVAQIGWKVGLTSRPIQEQFRVHEPVFGCLLSEGRIDSGHTFSWDRLIRPGFENEICVVLGRDLAGSELSVDEVAHGVARCHAALEIIETRGEFTDQLPLALADNAQQKFFVLGPPVPLTADLDLSAIGTRVTVNGAVVGTGRGEAVLGHPLRAVSWLAAKLAAFGRGLRAGDHVMTGSFTRQFAIERGDRIRTEFDRVGAVEAAFA